MPAKRSAIVTSGQAESGSVESKPAAAGERFDAASIESQLRKVVQGDVLVDIVSRGMYATDASHYQVMPRCVVVPRVDADVVAAIRLAGDWGLPVTARGGGTSLSGQTTWNGMILDFTKYMHQVLELNKEEHWVRVQPGVIRDELNRQLAESGLHFAPDPATGSRAAVGGMIGNNTSGTRSLIYGKTSENVISVRVVLADGTVCEFAPTDDSQWRAIEERGGREGELYRGVRKLVEENQDEIAARFPTTMRRVSGYALDAFLPGDRGQEGPWNLSHLIVGSEGTLGVLLEAKLRLQPLPTATSLCVVHFDDVIDSLAAVPAILQHHPSAVELLDDVILVEARSNPTTASKAKFFVGEPSAVQIVEFFADSEAEAGARARQLASDLETQGIGYAQLVCEGEAQAQVWEVRKLGLGLLTNVKGARKAIACIEDAAVPVEKLAEYIGRVRDVCRELDVDLCLYAHASVGVIHARPVLDLHDPEDVAKMRAVSWAAFKMVQEYGGSWASEHGDGLLRGEFIADFYGPQITAAFRQIKDLFDPPGLMNPGKIVASGLMTERLRYGESYQPQAPDATFHYRDQGGFVLAVEQCAGIGACRKKGEGTMCPSYMATRDEEHTTRGRANALRLAMSGQLQGESLTGQRMQQVLDLCLSCKACKTECPTAVDMARLKSDVLQMRHTKFGTPLGAKLLGNVASAAKRSAGSMAPVVNWLQELVPVRWALQRLAQVDRRRPLPRFARQTLEQWFAQRGSHATAGQLVFLFCDTFTNYFEPHVGQAAIELLEGCGYQVDLASVGCCQRPQISRGLVKAAAQAGAQTMSKLDALTPDVPILVLEPSCASALVDDVPDLINDQQRGARVAGRVQLVDVFLASELAAGKLEVEFIAVADELLIHGHCHQKALFGTDSMKVVLDSIEGLRYTEVDSGCCGMAGAFGYEHYDLSQTIGEDRLFPAVRACQPETVVVACGISCRHQLKDFLGVEAKHWVEVVQARTRQPAGRQR
jgi:FAD/FMN-containing dehydrogenase/Fe-S oxidoreductase